MVVLCERKGDALCEKSCVSMLIEKILIVNND